MFFFTKRKSIDYLSMHKTNIGAYIILSLFKLFLFPNKILQFCRKEKQFYIFVTINYTSI